MENQLKVHHTSSYIKLIKPAVFILSLLLFFGFFFYQHLSSVKKADAVVGQLTIPGETTTINVESVQSTSLRLTTVSCGQDDDDGYSILKTVSNVGVVDCDNNVRVDDQGKMTVTGNIGIGTADPGVYRLYVNGGNSNFSGTGTFGNAVTVASGGIAVTGNSTITGSLSSLTGLTSSGTITFSGLTGLLKSNAGSGLSVVTGTTNYIPKWSDANTLSGTSSIFDNGNVGIGTSVPETKLHVVGNNTIAAMLLSNSNASGYGGIEYRKHDGSTWGAYIGLNSDDNYVRLNANSIPWSFVSGNVGIGTTSPGARLEVNSGDILLKAAASDIGDLIFQESDANQKGRIWTNGSAGAEDMYLSSGDNTADLTVYRDGNIGIGKDPETKLDVGTTTSHLIRSYGGFTGHATANIDGTVDAAYFPNGAYMTGPNWIYGAITFNGALSGATSFTTAGTVTASGGNSGNWNTAYSHVSANGSSHTFINQNVTTTGTPTFATLSTGLGQYELYAMNQNVRSTDAVTFATVNTGLGANELYDMNQHVLTTSAPTFAALTVSGNIGFSLANPTLSASSYFIAPGGAYFNSGTVYAEATIQARGGIADDGGDLSIPDQVFVSGGEIRTNYANSLRIVQGNYGTFWRNDGTGLFLMITNSGDQYGSWNSFRPLIVDLANGNVSLNHNVHIGGSAGIVGSLTVGSWTGGSPYYSTCYQGGTGKLGTCAASDARLKTDIKPLEEGYLDKFMKIKPVRFTWLDSNTKETGMIAQEMLPLIPELVRKDEEGYYNFEYSKLFPYTIKAIQEQQTQVIDLQRISQNLDLTSSGDIAIVVNKNNAYVKNTTSNSFIKQIAALSELVVGKLKAGIIDTQQILVKGIDVMEKIAGLEKQVKSQQQQIDELQKQIKELQDKQLP